MYNDRGNWNVKCLPCCEINDHDNTTECASVKELLKIWYGNHWEINYGIISFIFFFIADIKLAGNRTNQGVNTCLLTADVRSAAWTYWKSTLTFETFHFIFFLSNQLLLNNLNPSEIISHQLKQNPLWEQNQLALWKLPWCWTYT